MAEQERRVEDLEVKVAFLEKQLLDLNEVVREQGDALDRLALELRLLRRQLELQADGGKILG